MGAFILSALRSLRYATVTHWKQSSKDDAGLEPDNTIPKNARACFVSDIGFEPT